MQDKDSAEGRSGLPNLNPNFSSATILQMEFTDSSVGIAVLFLRVDSSTRLSEEKTSTRDFERLLKLLAHYFNETQLIKVDRATGLEPATNRLEADCSDAFRGRCSTIELRADFGANLPFNLGLCFAARLLMRETRAAWPGL